VALVARSKGAASSLWEQTSLEAGSLAVIVNVVDNDAPLAFHILGTLGHGIHHFGGTDVTLRTSPVGGIVGRVPSGGPSVVRVVEGLLLVLGNHVYQVVSRLVGDVSVLLGEEVIGSDGSLDLVLGILSVFQAVGESGVVSACGGHTWVAVSVLIGMLVAVSRCMMTIGRRMMSVSRLWVMSICWRVDGAQNDSGACQNDRLESKD